MAFQGRNHVRNLMPLDDLVNVVGTLQKRIVTRHQSLQQSETRTRMVLIDPLLNALGWDVLNPNLVMPEYKIGERRADYVLKGSGNTLVAIVEAKRLGHALDDKEWRQMLTYANMKGVPYAAVTDGNVWELYEVFRQAPLEDRRLLSLKITDNRPAHKLALELLLLWRPNLASESPIAAKEPVLDIKQKPTKTLHQSVETSLDLSHSALSVEANWIKLSSYNPSPNIDVPKAIKFPNGIEKSLKTWRDLLVVTGEWLNTTGKLAPVSNPILRRSLKKILDTDSSSFRAASCIPGTKFWLNIYGSADSMRRKTRTLLSHCGINPNDILLFLADDQTH